MLIALFVAGGAVVAGAVLPSVQTPAEVAKTYLDARYAGDWETAWALECSMTHSFVGGPSRFGRFAASWDEDLSLPRHVVVEVADDLRADEQLDGIVMVTAQVTSTERRGWSVSGELPLLVRDDQIQVCDGGLRLGQMTGS